MQWRWTGERGGGRRKTKGRVDLGFFFSLSLFLSLSLSATTPRLVVTHFVDSRVLRDDGVHGIVRPAGNSLFFPPSSTAPSTPVALPSPRPPFRRPVTRRTANLEPLFRETSNSSRLEKLES